MRLKRIVVHIGLPKSASTALQNWFHDHRSNLKQDGVCYPPPPNDPTAPKHQDLVWDMLQGHCASLGRYIANCDQPTLFLSTEGLTNHLFDYDDAALADFRHHSQQYPVDLIIVHRDPMAWVRSQWAQALVNGVMPQYLYGTALRVDEFAKHPRNQFLMDIKATQTRAKDAYGARDVLLTNPATAQTDIARFLGVNTAGFAPMQRHHVSPSPDILELIRQINRIGLDVPERAIALGALQHLHPSGHNQLIACAQEFLRHDARPALARIVPNLHPENDRQSQIIDQLRALISDPQNPTAF